MDAFNRSVRRNCSLKEDQLKEDQLKELKINFITENHDNLQKAVPTCRFRSCQLAEGHVNLQKIMLTCRGSCQLSNQRLASNRSIDSFYQNTISHSIGCEFATVSFAIDFFFLRTRNGSFESEFDIDMIKLNAPIAIIECLQTANINHCCE